MDRRSFLSLVGSSPIFSYISDLRTEEKKQVYHVENIYAHYTDYRQQIEYRFEEGPIHTKPFENREYDEWFERVSKDARYQGYSVPYFTILSDCDLKALHLEPNYSKSILEKNEYEIQIHSRTTRNPTFLVQYYTSISEDMKEFEADSRAEITAKLDRRNVIF